MNGLTSAVGYIGGVFLAGVAFWMFASGEWTTMSWVQCALASVVCFMAGHSYQKRSEAIDEIGPALKADENYEEYVSLAKTLLTRNGAVKTWDAILASCGNDVDKAKEKLLSALPAISFRFFEVAVEEDVGVRKIKELCGMAGIEFAITQDNANAR